MVRFFFLFSSIRKIEMASNLMLPCRRYQQQQQQQQQLQQRPSGLIRTETKTSVTERAENFEWNSNCRENDSKMKLKIYIKELQRLNEIYTYMA